MMREMTQLQTILEQAEWKSAAETSQKQQAALSRLLEHALNTVPFYQRFYRDNRPEHLPVLTRDVVFAVGDEINSTELPPAHGCTYRMETSGSTGQNIEILCTDLTRLFYDALMLREHRWRKREFSHGLMAIRWARRDYALAPEGIYQTSWGQPIDQYKETGPGIFINISSANQDQISAILHYQPRYLQTYPSQLAALAAYCLDQNIDIPFLLEARVTGETYTEKHKKLIEQAWPQMTVSDVYSCVEVGAIAQQCPEYDSYHVNVENCLIEIVDENNAACDVGQAGKVLLTTLMNYATPLIRYEIGDYAEWGESCRCGRGSPVIRKIMGRKRNRLILPNGESRFPYLGEREDVPDVIKGKIRKFQIIQQTVHDIEVKFVVSSALTIEHEQFLKDMFRRNFVYPFNIIITYHDDIPLGANGKYEEFISMVA